MYDYIQYSITGTKIAPCYLIMTLPELLDPYNDFFLQKIEAVGQNLDLAVPGNADRDSNRPAAAVDTSSVTVL